MDFIIDFLIGTIPTWVWIVVAGLLLGWAWKVFGWQGIVGAGLMVLSLGMYRQGWRDRDEDKAPIAPVADRPKYNPVPKPAQRPRKRRTLLDILNGR